jgi:hypothetical protein
MALELSGSINISGSMTATTIIVSAPGAAGMVSSSNQLVELNTATGSLIGITNGLTAYTASLKAAAIISSSQQVQNYNLFAVTSSANTFYGTQTFVNTETTFNFNPQTNLLASYNYLNFGGGSIMYRNASDIYIGSNAKYGSAGTVVANYTSANGMGMLTMDGASLRYQATDVSVTAGNAYGVPIRFAINGDGNVGVNTTAPVASFLTGSLTIRKSYNNDIASAPSTTAQSYYSNQSGLYLFGRNSGLSIIGGNSEEATICYGNASTHRFASISVGTGTDAVGGDLYVKVGSDTERLRITATSGYLRLSNSGGIQFNGDTAEANSLDDYEEGFHSPNVDPVTSGTVTLNAGYDVLSYVKIGSIVHVSGLLSISSVSSPVGSFRISLPFQCANLNDASGTTAANIILNGTDSINIPNFVGWVDELTSYIVVYRADGLSVANTSAQQLKANTDIYLQVTYRAS